MDCGSRSQFEAALQTVIRDWNHQDQLVLYYSGHGCMRNGKYVLMFGKAPTHEYLPFDNVASDLQTHGVKKAVLILDACHSGAAMAVGQKSASEPRLEQDLPSGIVVLASCRKSESSFEFEEGRGSVFTHLLTQGIKSGLDGKPTPDGLIGPADIMTYMNDRLAEPEFADYPQSPTYQVSSADRAVWLARNPARAEEPASQSNAGARSIEELQLLYERTEASRRPCPGPTVEDLDWELIRQYADALDVPVRDDETHEDAARRLRLFCPFADTYLHNAAVLCFARQPHEFMPQARSVFVRGSISGSVIDRTDVLGPLSSQVRQLVDLTVDEAQRKLKWRPNSESALVFADVVREAVSNAVAHRDYASNAHVQVKVEIPHIQITNPGSFPQGTSFEALLRAGAHSEPNDAAVAWYLTRLLAYEGVGRGFSVYNRYIDLADEVGALECDDRPETRSIRLSVRLPRDFTLEVPEERTVSVGSLPAVPGDLERGSDADAGRDEEVTGAGSQRPALDESTVDSGTDSRDRIGRPGTVQLPSRQTSDDISGRRLGGDRYVLESRLGHGARGAVYAARDLTLDRRVAIKVLSTRFFTSEARERFRHEAMISARFDHPGIVRLYDVGEEREFMFLVMELVEGTNLEEFIALSAALRKEDPDGYYLEVARIVRDVAEALAAAHERKVVHRDIKPGNIILGRDGRPRVLDFGISRAADGDIDSLTQTGIAIGTPHYMSPEQIYDAKRAGPETDIFSLGVVMFELLTSKRPFVADSAMAVLMKINNERTPSAVDLEPGVPRLLAAICLRAMEKRPADRFRSAQSMAQALKVFLDGSVDTQLSAVRASYDSTQSFDVPRLSLWQRIRRRLRRSR